MCFGRQEFSDRTFAQAPLAHPDLRWDRYGAGTFGDLADGKGTCLTSKVAGKRFGAAKNTMVIFIAMPMKLSALFWVFAAIHDDIVGRRSTGIVKPRKTVISSPLSISWYWFRELPEHFMAGLIQALEMLTGALQVPVVQSVKGYVQDDDGAPDWFSGTTDSLPARFKQSHDIPLLLVGGTKPLGTYDTAGRTGTDMGNRRVRIDGDIDFANVDVFALSAGVSCATPDNSHTFIDYGSSGAAAAAAAGTLINLLANLSPTKFRLSVGGQTSDDTLDVKSLVERFGRAKEFSHIKNYSPDELVDLFSWKRPGMAPVIWNGLDGLKPGCRPRVNKRQEGNATEQCPADSEDNASLGVMSDTSIQTPPASSGGPQSSSIIPSSSAFSPTTAPPVMPTAISSMDCFRSWPDLTKLPKDYATKAITDFCTGSSRRIMDGRTTFEQRATATMADYIVKRDDNDNRCNKEYPMIIGMSFGKDDPAAAGYAGWPQEMCNDVLHRIADQCEWGGTQRVGIFDGFINLHKCS